MAPPDDVARDHIADLYALGDYAGAASAAELRLGMDSRDDVAQRYADAARAGLEAQFTTKLGSLDRVYAVTIDTAELKWLGLDPQALRVIPLLDGVASLDGVLEHADMERLDVLKLLVELLDAGAISRIG